MNSLEGRAALVTGAARGVGQATAELLAGEGAAVAVVDLDGEGARRAAQAIVDGGGRAVGVEADVGDPAAVEAAVAEAARALGHLDTLVNNAAALDADTLGRDTDVVTIPLEVWDRTLRVNLTGPMLACRFALPHLMESGGAIVNISTIGSLRGRWSQVAYGVSKTGLNALTDYIATTYGREGVRCNAIAPGIVTSASSEAHLSEDDRRVAASHRLIERPGRPGDIAAAVRFLVSDEAAYITGQVLVVDGGTINHLPTYASYGPGRRSLDPPPTREEGSP